MITFLATFIFVFLLMGGFLELFKASPKAVTGFVLLVASIFVFVFILIEIEEKEIRERMETRPPLEEQLRSKLPSLDDLGKRVPKEKSVTTQEFVFEPPFKDIGRQP